MRFRPLSVLICVAVTFLSLLKAEACQDGYSSNSAGLCEPNWGGDVANAVDHLTQEAKAQLGGVPLEQWIIASRNSAISGTMPIPPNIQADLTGYASEDSMKRVRYKVGDNGFANLAAVLEEGGFANAVTLIDVVIFRTQDDANNPATWAHELTHVDQYASWGVHGFAIHYARDYNSVESPAYAKGNGYQSWANIAHATVAPPPPGLTSTTCSPPIGQGPININGPAVPVGQPCSFMYQGTLVNGTSVIMQQP